MLSKSRSGLMKSIVFYSNFFEDACAYLRVFGPIQRLGIDIIAGKEKSGVTHPERVESSDLVLLQRDFPRDFAVFEKIIELSQRNHKPVVFDLDDLLFLLPENHPERFNHHYTEALLPMFDALQEVDYITVATSKLKEILSQYKQDIFVLPNYFDDSIWKLRTPVIKNPDEPVIIGFMGSESHQPDIEFIAPALENILKQYSDKVLIYFWGVKPARKLTDYPLVKWIPAKTYNYVEFAKYFQAQYSDIFIAPLVDNPFNAAKSPLKFFEYTALGTPGVYSRIEPFEQVIVHGENGFLASSLDEWEENIRLLINNQELRLQVATRAQMTIRDNWLLSKNLSIWQAAYEKMYSSKKDEIKNSDATIIKSITLQNHLFHQRKNQELAQREQELAQKNQELQLKEESVQSLNFELAEIKVSKAWKIALLIRKMRLVVIPPNSSRAKIARLFFHWLQGEKIKLNRRKKISGNLDFDSIVDSKVDNCKPLEVHKECIDIIVCVHNALEDVKKCLESILAFTTDPFTVIIVDDGSDDPTKDFLNSFASSDSRVNLIRNETAKGYTFAANIGMKASQSTYFVLLNSDTLVGPEWIDRMYRAINSGDKLGVVGPLSNTASWQSVPTLSDNGDWAVNVLPKNITPSDMSKWVAKYSGCIFPEVPLLNGFCLMIRKDVTDEIGYFDEENFGQGYGEEDDFNLRAENAGWKKIIADDVYIYHAQSKSYSHSRRYNLSRVSGEKLRLKHGTEKIADSVAFMNPNRVIEGIRSRADVLFEREEVIELGRNIYSGKKLLYILPVIDAGGGANVIIDEARCMMKMGVDVSIFNLPEYKKGFLESYPHIDIPLVFGETKDLEKISAAYDAVIASANYSVEWLKPLESKNLILGYYIQGFEPLMYPEDSANARQALSTYTMIDKCRRFTKTEWTRQMVRTHTGVDSDVVGVSVNTDLFRPRDTIPFGKKPVRITAMVRPGSPYRNPIMTLSLLKNVEEKFGNKVQIWLFGANDIRDIVDSKYLDFNWKQFGKLTQYQVASMMSKADIFTDFSSHQAMGLTALEAMSAGCSVIVPKNGGATEFVNDRKNGIVVDTSNFQSSLNALDELIEDDNLRKELQIAAIRDVVHYFPEKASLQILNSLFKNKD